MKSIAKIALIFSGCFLFNSTIVAETGSQPEVMQYGVHHNAEAHFWELLWFYLLINFIRIS